MCFMFQVDEEYLGPDFFLDDATDDTGRRHLIFATQQQLTILAAAKTWYVDGTFKVVNKPFKQLFSIHAFIRSGSNIKQIPLAFVLMNSRAKDDYIAVFQCIIQHLQHPPQVTTVVADFEAGTHIFFCIAILFHALNNCNVILILWSHLVCLQLCGRRCVLRRVCSPNR